ncbi:MAG: hypothetical protein K9K66_01845 [Desulfarculaceae bacterium]|nr:hypothetical protein [Desulfarculaceae bacterium]MCF8073475.1 hypothetical protein [Desulfarculaceae bacterium]MCF8100378.1 hypothetical protein [Desulfarculaceae bacterium]MCF8115886.1 hypothetical protein [Desulfarculaceae bacterium]
MTKRIFSLALLLALLAAAPALAAPPVVTPQGGALSLYSPAPRYQIFQAPRPYGGMLMMDTKTGQSWQRIIVNTPQGIQIRWLKLPQVEGINEGETILWN